MWLVLVPLALAEPALDEPAPAPAVDWHVHTRFGPSLPVERSGRPPVTSPDLPVWRENRGGQILRDVLIGLGVAATWSVMGFGTVAAGAEINP